MPWKRTEMPTFISTPTPSRQASTRIEQTWSAQPTMTTGYHTYGVMWNAQTVTFYFDGQVTGQQVTPSDMQGRMYMLADLAMQMKTGVTDNPKHLNIDYIRAFSIDSAVPTVALGPISSPDGADTSSMYGAASLASPTGQGALTLRVSGDHYAGDPQFQVFVDGSQVGGTQSVTAVHANSQWQDISVSGNFDPNAAHHVEVRFINDAWDGGSGEGHDRNLYVGSITVGTQVIAGTNATSNTASYGNDGLDPHAAVMAGNGTVAFDTSATVMTTPHTPASPSLLATRIWNAQPTCVGRSLCRRPAVPGVSWMAAKSVERRA